VSHETNSLPGNKMYVVRRLKVFSNVVIGGVYRFSGWEIAASGE
jgi:hypothetical protein